MLELLLWDTGSPRALIYQLHTARLHLDALAPPQQRCQGDRLLHGAEERLKAGANCAEDLYIDAGEREILIQVLKEVTGSLSGTSDAIAQTWFTHVQALHALNAESLLQ